MRALRPKVAIVLALATVVAAGGVGVAFATVTTTLLSDTHPTGGPSNQVRLRIARAEFVPSADQPTFNSGWHTHPGPVIFQVQKGRVTFTDANCETKVVRAGETHIETPDQPLLATAKRATTFTVSFILPADKPLSSPAPDPCQGADDDEDD